ncbi:SmpA / OmlA family protein [Marinobacter sp. es.048]|uniref:outer membrane protein assembly factor BamE domain-containing protein n=1 Tax=Marinobacter sp. es.048 TaxID=1761795 RepID=UPI000B749570|nr:outer membrane protein assembly factor BamE [Marinobacter sp. es.048]SNC59366.1 SmpA / OmlA family protein [Marinobacter sp. es.048]
MLGFVLSGCATNGGQGNGMSDAAGRVGGVLEEVANGVGAVFGGMLQPYTNGVKVTDEQMAQLEVGMPASRVEQLIGYPTEIRSLSSGEVWSYPYSEIPHFGENINETTVIRFDPSGLVTKAYKTNARGNASGNPLIDAANGLQ